MSFKDPNLFLFNVNAVWKGICVCVCVCYIEIFIFKSAVWVRFNYSNMFYVPTKITYCPVKLGFCIEGQF